MVHLISLSAPFMPNDTRIAVGGAKAGSTPARSGRSPLPIRRMRGHPESSTVDLGSIDQGRSTHERNRDGPVGGDGGGGREGGTGGGARRRAPPRTFERDRLVGRRRDRGRASQRGMGRGHRGGTAGRERGPG